MLSHHFITIALIIGSYRYHHNAVGNLILVLFDLGDILLSVRRRGVLDLPPKSRSSRTPLLTGHNRVLSASNIWASPTPATLALDCSCWHGSSAATSS